MNDSELIFIDDYAILPDGKVEVYQQCGNTLGSLRDVATAERITFEDKWNTRQAGATIIRELGGHDQAITRDYVIIRESDNSIKIFKKCGAKDSILRTLADKMGCPYDRGDRAEALASKIVAFKTNGGIHDGQQPWPAPDGAAPSQTYGKKTLIIVSPYTLNMSFERLDEYVDDFKTRLLKEIKDGKRYNAKHIIENEGDLYYVHDTYWAIVYDHSYRTLEVYDADNIKGERPSKFGPPIQGIGFWDTDGVSHVPSGLPSEYVNNMCAWSKKRQYNKQNLALAQHYPFEIWGADQIFVFRQVVDRRHPQILACEIDLNGRPFDSRKLFFFQKVKALPFWNDEGGQMIQLSGLVYDGHYYPITGCEYGDGFNEESIFCGVIEGDMNYGKIILKVGR